MLPRLLSLVFLVAVLALPSPAVAEAPVWDWPLAGTPTIDRSFQPPKTAYGAGHRGVDLRGETGEEVFAAGAGRVSYAGLLAGKGVVVVVHANGLRTTYEPVQAAVRVGERVARGERLGTLRAGHGSCRIGTTCLHWGLRRGEVYLNPLSLVSPGKLRLLPLGPGPQPRVLAGAPEPRRSSYGPVAKATLKPAPPRQQAGRPSPWLVTAGVLGAAGVAGAAGLARVGASRRS